MSGILCQCLCQYLDLVVFGKVACAVLLLQQEEGATMPAYHAKKKHAGTRTGNTMKDWVPIQCLVDGKGD